MRIATSHSALLVLAASSVLPNAVHAAVAGAGPAVSISTYGILPDGRQVKKFRFVNARGTAVSVLDYGATLIEVTHQDRAGNTANIAVARRDLSQYLTLSNFSSVLGRVANRISGGGFVLDGVRHNLADAVEGIVLHGGSTGLGLQVWRAEPFGTRGIQGVVLRYQSPDGAGGFPGTLDVEARFSLDERDVLRLELSAVTSRPTVVNLSHHAYFNLAGSASRDVSFHCVQIPARKFTTPVVARAPSTGILPVAGTALDLRRPTLIGPRISSAPALLPRGFDHNFVLTMKPGNRMKTAARLWDPASGRSLEVRTTAPSLQFYTPRIAVADIPGRRPGEPLGAPTAYAVEPQYFPDTPNHPEFPSIVLRPGEVWRNTIEWRLGLQPTPRGCRRQAAAQS